MNLLFFLSLILSINVFAGADIVGNGGDVVLCDKKLPELLDFYEHRFTSKKIVEFEKENPLIQVKLILNKLKTFDPDRYYRFSKSLETFINETEFVDQPLVNIYDAGWIVEIPEGCGLRQIAKQIPNLNSSGKRYFIDKSLWNLLPTTEKRGLILHEIIYREFLEIGQISSFNARIFNSFINSVEFQTLTSDQYKSKIRSVGLNDFSSNPELKEIQRFVLNNISGRTFYRSTKNQFRNGGNAVADVERRSLYSNAQISQQRLFFKVTDYIKSIRYDLDENFKRKTPGQITKRTIQSQLIITRLKSISKFKIEIFPISDSEVASTRGVSYGEVSFDSNKAILTWSIRSSGVSDYRQTNSTFVPGVTKSSTQFLFSGKDFLRLSDVSFLVVDPKTLKPIKQLQSYKLKSKRITRP